MLTEEAPGAAETEITRPRSRARAVLIGGATGAALALVSTVVIGGRFALQSAVATPRSETDPRAAIEFVASSGGLYLVVTVLGAAVAMGVAGVSYAVGREADSEAPRYPLRAMMPVAAAIGAILGYGVVRLGLGLMADITAGVVTISISRMLLLLVVAGAAIGITTGDAVDRLARPQLLGLEGIAVPDSTGAMIAEMMRAIATPVIALVFAGVFAVVLSQLLLEAAHISATLAVAIFSVAGAIILAVAVLLAYRPWHSGSDDDAN